MRKYLFGIIVLLFAVPVAARAFSVSPLRYTLTLDPGTSQTFTLTVNNTDSTDQSYRILFSKLTFTDAGQARYEEVSADRKNWLVADVNNFTLKKNDKKTVVVTAAVPVGVVPGSYTFAAIIESSAKENTAVGISGRVALPVVVVVAGTVTEAARISDWHSSQNIFTSPNLQFFVSVANEGTINIASQARVKIKDENQAVISKKDVVMGNQILSGSVRTIPIMMTLEKASAFWPKRYTAEVLVAYGQQRVELQSAVRFWYIPKSFLVAVIILCGALVVSTMLMIRKKKTV